MRRVRRKGGNKEKVFGCDLLDHLNTSSQEIPLVLRCCSEFVEKHGIVDGIYRLSGVSSNIQKLRGEFESEGSPDLSKDVYLQDIHCVSSLCKAYFRELPNPLLTYQLYDKFAEAVAIQLEEERLVKISDVLKELPTPHHRTLEFLMRHLVRMASYSSETNMHARNLAIVWAPNLLRSKDIEVSGFNGTAAFMEVRVQSIVVEFILTHVPQLFPSQGVSQERRSSLPFPTAASCGGGGLSKSAASQPVQNFGNISPGDGPLPIRPYHAIIEGTDKRKGSLKGRKWMSIFNIGGRFHDPRRRHKHSAKEKERPSLRPARSMDSLSTSPYPNEGSRHPAQRPPPNTSTPVPSSPKSDVSASTPAISGSEYAVTYRRGTGLVSGATGTQGTYTALDPEGLGLTGSEMVQSRSPGLSTKVGRRAAMHITGPTMVTVPLHITSNLALGVLQGGGADRVVHRGREKDGGERKESIVSERKKEEGGKEGDEEIDSGKVTDREHVVEVDRRADEGGSDEEEGGKGQEEEDEKVREENKRESMMVMRNRTTSRERSQSFTASTEEDREDAADDDKDVDSIDEYMDMRNVMEVTQHDIFNSTEVEDDLGLSGYVQDNFEFLDQMDCSVLDHMDCGVSYQANEFSVEPPGHSDDEYEAMEQYQSAHHPAELCPEAELNPHRPLSLDVHSRHTKSLSLPYMTSPVHGPEELSSEEAEDDESGSYSSEMDESMFTQSLPSNYILDDLSGFVPAAFRTDRHPDGDSRHQEETNAESAGEEEQKEEKDQDDVQLEEKETTEKGEEVQYRGDEQESQSRATEEDSSVAEETQSDDQPRPLETLTHLCPSEDPTPSSQESNSSEAPAAVEELETTHDPLPDPPPFGADACVKQEEDIDTVLAEFVDFSTSLEDPQPKVRRGSDEGEDRVSREVVCEGLVVGTNESEENMRAEIIMDTNEQIEDDGQIEADGREEESVVREEEEEFGEERSQKAKTAEAVEEGKAEAEVRKQIESAKEKLQGPEELEVCEEQTNSQHGKELDRAIRETQQHGTENVDLEQKDGESNERKGSAEQRITIQSLGREFKEVKSNIKAPKDVSDGIRGGFGSKLIVSKQPKFYQIKAVPVVPPKPQHCKITALTLKHQQQQRERRENAPRAWADGDRARDRDREDEGSEEEGRKEKRRDMDEGLSNRNSPLSMNFEEAVAMATMKREKERECEKGKERQKD